MGVAAVVATAETSGPVTLLSGTDDSITVLSDDRSSADGIKDAPGVMNETASPLKASMAAMDLAFLCLIAVVWTCSLNSSSGAGTDASSGGGAALSRGGGAL